jgi:signal transduction histidine kinase
MSLRNKLLVWFVALGFAPALALAAVGYLVGTRAVGELTRAQAEQRAERVEHGVGRVLDERRRLLDEYAHSLALRRFVAEVSARAPSEAEVSALFNGPGMESPRVHLQTFFRHNRTVFESITGFDAAGHKLFSFGAPQAGGEPVFRTTELLPDHVLPEAAGAPAAPRMHAGPHGSVLLVTAHIPAVEGGTGGALVLEIRLRDLFGVADESEAAPTSGEQRARHEVLALDNDAGRVVYHTDPGLRHRPAADAMPYFAAVAQRMRAGESGAAEYTTAGGDRWLASFRQVRDLPLSLAVAENYTAASAPVRRAGLVAFGVALAAGLAGVLLLVRYAQRAERDLARLTVGAREVARGDFSTRVETGDMTAEARPLGEGFNDMTERLRAHVTTTSETKQFESFMRLSAILSHDLKNAVAGLALLVSNMEKHLHREEFREEAIRSLTHATEKLRRLAARLTEPAKSLSGEYRRESRPTDLVAVIRRVLAANVAPHAPLYEVKADLPDQLVAAVEPDRIENVVENLVINGVQAMGAAGGRLTVEAGRLEDGLVYFSVADTGVGMAPEFLRTRLYRPFATTKEKGIGLGLYTCREVVEAHGGRLEVESQLGVGTRFRVVLPSSLFTSGDPRTRPQKGTATSRSAEQPGS